MHHQVYVVRRKVVNEIDIGHVWVCKFVQRCIWSIRCSGIWCTVNGWLVPDVLEQYSTLLKGLMPKDDRRKVIVGHLHLWRWDRYIDRNRREPFTQRRGVYPRRTESLAGVVTWVYFFRLCWLPSLKWCPVSYQLNPAYKSRCMQLWIANESMKSYFN